METIHDSCSMDHDIRSASSPGRRHPAGVQPAITVPEENDINDAKDNMRLDDVLFYVDGLDWAKLLATKC